jgi:hypothetical protein
MRGFKVRKEDITIELAGMRATQKMSTQPSTEKNAATDGRHSASYDNIDSPNIRENSLEIKATRHRVKATELLIIDIRRISALLNDASWSFEQTYLPYLKGDGIAKVELYGGSIRLQFELSKRRKIREGNNKSELGDWEPVLCLHGRQCQIAEVDLVLQGEGRLTWLLNKLAAICKGALRDYVVKTIMNVLISRSGWILERLNGILSSYWDLILKTSNLSMVCII